MRRAIVSILVLFLTASLVLMAPTSLHQGIVHALTPTPDTLAVTRAGTTSSNITDLSLTPNSVLQVNVNVTGTTQLVGFDITLDYNITVGPNVLQAIAATSGLTGGLFDPTSNPGGCNIQVAKSDIDKPAGKIRFAAVSLSQCSEPGTGMLFSITFVVTGMGATSIDIVTASTLGRPGSSLVGGVGTPIRTFNLPYNAFSAYFRNKAGLPPIAQFNFTPSNPLIGNVVHFNATTSYDPDNRAAPNNGMGTETIVYDSNKDNLYNTGKFYNDTIIIGSAPANNTRLKTDNKLAFVDLVGDSVWHPGETVVWDSTASRVFGPNDFVIAGPSTTVGTALKFDPLIKYVDTHAHGFWDNGYIWDFGDGTSIVPGNVTSHVYTIQTSHNATGLFLTRLVVYDADNNLPQRDDVVIDISPGIVHDIATTVTLTKTQLSVGDPLGVNASIANEGTQNDTVRLLTSYDLNGRTIIGNESLLLPCCGAPGYIQQFNYTIPTNSLPARAYTVTVQGIILNSTNPSQVIPDPTPLDDFKTEAFQLQGNVTTALPLPIILGGAAAVIVVVSAITYLLRRRRAREDQL